MKYRNYEDSKINFAECNKIFEHVNNSDSIEKLCQAAEDLFECGVSRTQAIDLVITAYLVGLREE